MIMCMQSVNAMGLAPSPICIFHGSTARLSYSVFILNDPLFIYPNRDSTGRAVQFLEEIPNLPTKSFRITSPFFCNLRGNPFDLNLNLTKP